MVEAKNKKMNFVQRLYKSIIDFDAYSKFSEENLSTAIKYLAKLVLIFSIIVSLTYVISINKKVNEGVKYLSENVEDINITDGKLSYNNNEVSIYEGENNLVPIIIVDTSENPDIEEHKSKVKLYNFGVIILKDKVLVEVSGVENVETMSYSELGIEEMNKDEILQLFNNSSIYGFLTITIFMMEFMQYFIYALMVAVILAIVGNICALIVRIKLPFKATYAMGIYALTLPTILQLLYIVLNLTTGFVIQYFSWMYTTIAYIYVCVAILMIKTDFINLKREMIKIKLEQENKEKLQEPQEEKTDDKEDEKKEKDEENGDEKDLKEQTDG